MHQKHHRLNKLRLTSIALLAIMLLSQGIAAAESRLPPLGYLLTPIANPVEAPDFILKDMDEKSHDLKAYRGKVVMVNFWATWCPPCRREMPSMERLYQKYKDKGFVVLAINQWENPDHVFAFTGELSEPPSFPILFDPKSEVSAAFEVKGLPSTYLLDKQGKVRFKAVGGREFDHPEVEKIIESLL